MKKDNEKVISYRVEDEAVRILFEENGENRFNRLLKSLRTYNMTAFKEFHFEFIPKIKQGEILGNLIGDNLYEYLLPCDILFEKVYGKLRVIYRLEDKVVRLLSIEPSGILYECSTKMLDTYKGLVITSPKDKFKVDIILATLNNKED